MPQPHLSILFQRSVLGLCLGLSSGINVAGAVRLAQRLGPGKRIATILCDSGFRYLSTLYNPEWLASKGLAEAAA